MNNCADCSEYNREKSYCPAFCKVIAETVEELKQEAIQKCWTSVSEKQPETNGTYIVAVNGANKAHIARYYKRLDGRNNVWQDDWMEIKNITHWMPLPKPPEAEE